MQRRNTPNARTTHSRRNFLTGAAATAAWATRGCFAYAGEQAQGITSLFTFDPMSTEVTAHTAVLWARTTGETAACFEYGTDPAFQKSARTKGVETNSEGDFILASLVEGLLPGTRYFYRPVAGRCHTSFGPPGTFTTPPEGEASCLLAFSGDLLAKYKPFRILDAITSAGPDVFLLTGDAAYANHPKSTRARDLDSFRVKHSEVRTSPELQALLASTATYAMWDDHDCDNNTHRQSPLLLPARKAFRDYWPVRPHESAGDALYRSFNWGSLLEVFLLDSRSFRDPETTTTNPKTMLGAAQKTWLEHGLATSKAKYKVLMSPAPLLPELGKDGWFGFPEERDEVRKWLGQAGNAIVLSGDFHLAWHLEDAEYGFHEFVAGPLGSWPFAKISKKHLPKVEASGRFAMTDALNYGLLRLDAGCSGSSVTVSFHDEDGKEQYRSSLG